MKSARQYLSGALMVFIARFWTPVMPLTTTQRTMLERYKKFKEDPPTVWGLISLSVINHAAAIMVTGASVAIMLAMNMPSAAFFFVGTAFGALCRDGGMFRRTVQIWPVLLIVLDWKKIDAVLTGDLDAPAT